jgi:hypothetical protein
MLIRTAGNFSGLGHTLVIMNYNSPLFIASNCSVNLYLYHKSSNYDYDGHNKGPTSMAAA